uniref:Uncharacterized protein n=1 Tax=Johanseniella sp. A1345 TaxID=380087 RepID=A4L7C2_9NOST|nr:hypothetical protein [Johanseniella A1345]
MCQVITVYAISVNRTLIDTHYLASHVLYLFKCVVVRSSTMNNIPESEIIKAVACDIPLSGSFLDAYMLPSGEKRFGIEGTVLLLGILNAGFTTAQKGNQNG